MHLREERNYKMEQQKETSRFLNPENKGILRILAVGAGILILVLAYAMIRNSMVYTSYEVSSTLTRSGDTSVYYHVMPRGMIRYSKDGISLTDRSGVTVWNQTYEMSSPMMSSSDSYIAIGDMEGNDIYIFDRYGQCGHLTTAVPIQAIELSEQGVVAAILSDATSNYINYYDKEGNELVSIKATIENTGYPLALGLSPDASRLAVSYLDISAGSVRSKIVFYDFSDTRSNHVMREVSNDSLCPKISFLDASRAAVFTENGFDLFSFGTTVEEAGEVTFDDDIKSVFSGSQKIGLIFKNHDEHGKYRIELYDREGQKIMTAYTDLDYKRVYADDEEIILFNDAEARIYSYNGGLRFRGTMDLAITDMMPSWETGTYWIISNQVVREIRIK